MLWAALAYALGIVAGVHYWRPTLVWIIGAVVFALAAAYLRNHRRLVGWALSVGSIFLAGALHVQMGDSSFHLDTDILPYVDREQLQITAHVTRDGRIQPAGAGEARETLDVAAEQIQIESGEVIPIHSGIRLSIYSRFHLETLEQEDSPAAGSAPIRPLRYGDRIRFVGRLKRPKNFRNPGAFDYRGYLAERGIAVLGSTKAEDVTVLPERVGSWVYAWRSRLHGAIVAKIHELWPAREAALLDAMIIGEESFIDRDTRADFQRSGTYHVLVVSGMNVTILALVVFWVLRQLHFNHASSALLTIAFCLAYAFVSGVGAPVWRATLMCAVYLGTRLFYRDRAMVNALGAAALGLLIFDPRQLFTASFQMTFLCVLIVSALGVPILERTAQLYRKALVNWDSNDFAAQLPPPVAQFRVDLQLISQRITRFIGKRWSRTMVQAGAGFLLSVCELLFISATMQMGLALPMAYYFHRATTIGLPSNLAVVPLIQALMPAALVALLLGSIAPWMAKLPVAVTTFALHGITGTVRGLGGLDVADIRVPTPPLAMIAVSAGALIFAMWAARRRRAAAIAGVVAIFVVSIILAFGAAKPSNRPGVLEVTAIDVGEGDSILLVSPQGKTVLIDAGGPIGPGGSLLDFGEDVVSPYLWARGFSRLDAVAITHGHSDHIGGMSAVIRNFHPKELWIGLLPPSKALDHVIATAQSLGVKIVRCWEGDEFGFGAAEVEVLFPPSDWTVGDKPQNNDSLVLRVSYRESSVLLEGDAERRVERRVAALHHPTANLLKVGHHGSNNATTPELLTSAHPQMAVISVGSGNSFGLPRMETLSRLVSSGTRIFRTDLNGATTFYLDGYSVTPSVAAVR